MSARLPLTETIATFRASPALQPKPKKPRAKSTHPESKFHVAVSRYLRLVIGPPGACSDLGVIWYSLETGAKRTKSEKLRNHNRGCISGPPDVDIYFAGRAFKIELKAPKGETSDSQEELHVELARARVPVLVARDLDAIVKVLDTWGIPHRRAVLG